MNSETRQVFLNEKPAEILIALRREDELYARKLSQRVDATYAHTVRTMEKLVNHGLVTRYQAGRKKEYVLTAEGRRLADSLTEFYRDETVSTGDGIVGSAMGDKIISQ